MAGTSEQRRRITAAICTLARRGRSMQSIRGARDPARLRQCGDLIRTRQKEARALKAEAQKLGFRMLALAATHAAMCVSCLKSALSECREVDLALRQARRAGRNVR